MTLRVHMPPIETLNERWGDDRLMVSPLDLATGDMFITRYMSVTSETYDYTLYMVYGDRVIRLAPTVSPQSFSTTSFTRSVLKVDADLAAWFPAHVSAQQPAQAQQPAPPPTVLDDLRTLAETPTNITSASHGNQPDVANENQRTASAIDEFVVRFLTGTYDPPQSLSGGDVYSQASRTVHQG